MKHLESKLQQSCVRWFDYQHSRYRLNLFAIPNGGRRGKIEAGILKGEGVRAGVADLFLAVPNGEYHGLFIEMKTESGRQTDTQKEFEKAVIAQGYCYTICRNFESFVNVVSDYLEK